MHTYTRYWANSLPKSVIYLLEYEGDYHIKADNVDYYSLPGSFIAVGLILSSVNKPIAVAAASLSTPMRSIVVVHSSFRKLGLAAKVTQELVDILSSAGIDFEVEIAENNIASLACAAKVGLTLMGTRLAYRGTKTFSQLILSKR